MSLGPRYKESKSGITPSDALISLRINCFHVPRLSCPRPLRQKKLKVLLCLGLIFQALGAKIVKIFMSPVAIGSEKI
jgi:hypothetical protein